MLAFSVNGQPIGQRKVTHRLPEGTRQRRRMNSSGTRAECCRRKSAPSDALEADDRADRRSSRRSAPCKWPCSQARLLHFAADLLTVLSSDPYVQAQILPPEMGAGVSPDIAIYQGTNLPAKSDFNSIWFLSGPPVAGSKPLRVTGWNSQHPVTRWVRTHDVSVRNPAALKAGARRHRSGIHRRGSAGAVDFGARTKWAQDSDHRLRSARFQFSAGVGVSRC